MSLAPLESRPAPLVFNTDRRRNLLHYTPTEIKHAPLSARARRQRRRHAWKVAWQVVLLVAMLLGVTAAASWTVLSR